MKKNFEEEEKNIFLTSRFAWRLLREEWCFDGRNCLALEASLNLSIHL
jgi:hypothetical protein